MSKKQKMTAVVLSQEKIAEDIYSMWLHTDQIAAHAKAGQFVSVYCNDGSSFQDPSVCVRSIRRRARCEWCIA